MKKLLLLLTMLAFSANAQELKVMSYNLRVDFGGDGENNWQFRREMLGGQIRFHQPDFIGTQEGKYNQLAYLLSKELTNYGYIGVSRDNSDTEGEFCAIFFNMEKFNALKQSTFWLSETPAAKSKGWDAAYERICTYVLFEEIATGKKLYVFNTHFDHVGETARQNSAKLLLQQIAAINKDNLPVILTGDFNSEPTSESYKIISKTMDDSFTATKNKPIGPVGTFNGFKFGEENLPRIDYIFVKKLDVLKYAVLTDSKENRYPSDHFPVMALLKFQ